MSHATDKKTQRASEKRERPSKDDERKRIIAAIIQENGRPLEGKTRLFKIYYLAHLFFWNDSEGVLTQEPNVVCLDRGPGIDDHKRILPEMEAAGMIKVSIREKGPYKEQVFEAKTRIALTPAERDAIRKAIKFLASKSCKDASEWSHYFSRTWKSSDVGDRLNIYLDVLSELEIEESKKRIDSVKTRLSGLFD